MAACRAFQADRPSTFLYFLMQFNDKHIHIVCSHSFDVIQNCFQDIQKNVGVMRLENKRWSQTESLLAARSALNSFQRKKKID
jgi:hypothetical protein